MIDEPNALRTWRERIEALLARALTTAAAAAAGLTAGDSTVVWRPGGTTAGNVFATWPEVVAAVAKLNGSITIGLDTDLAPAVIDPGAYDLRPAGVSGPVTFVNASKTPPFAAPFFQIGPGAVTIKGLSELDDVQVDNQSTVPVIAITTNGSFTLSGNAEIFQTGAAPFWRITAGTYSILLTDFSLVTNSGGGGPAIVALAPATVFLGVDDVAALDTDMLSAPVGVVVVEVAPAGRFFAQAAAPTVVPTIHRQVGTSTIVVGTGKTAAIPVFLNATSKILVSLKTPVGDALTAKGYAALDADRVPGSLTSGGSFKISALAAAGGGAINGVDVSTIDWEVIN